MDNKKLSPEEFDEIKKKRPVRRKLAKKSHYYFFSIYLNHYIKYAFANFHYEMFRITEDLLNRLTVLIAFRGSGKSTLLTLSYVIWSILGVQQKKFVLILSQTQAQAKMHMANIKYELEHNELLKADIGPFQEVSDEWGSNSIVLSNFGARITIASTEQSIRGIRHGEHRPDLVICDDVEDLNSVKTREGRDKTFQWLTGEVLPIGDQETKILIIGNLLHEDSLLMRLKEGIDNQKLEGKFFAYPLLDKDNAIAWPTKFKTMDDIEREKAKIGNESAWYREYLLKIISDVERVVHPEWIHYYENLPSEDSDDFLYYATAIDLAIAKTDTADYTAMVSAMICGSGENLRIYILPNPLNKRLDAPEALNVAADIAKTLQSKLIIEDVGYQRSLIQHLETSKNVSAEAFKPRGQDKRARLALVTHLIQNGKVLFPKKGTEELIQQLIGFGIEKHDDLADAFAMLLLKAIEDDTGEPSLYIFDMGQANGRGLVG